MLIVCYRLDGVGFKFQVTRPRTLLFSASLSKVHRTFFTRRKGRGSCGATSLRGFSWGRAGANIPPSIPKRVQSYYNFPRCPNLCTKYPASVITIHPQKQQKSIFYSTDRLTHYSDSLCRKEKKYQQKCTFLHKRLAYINFLLYLCTVF